MTYAARLERSEGDAIGIDLRLKCTTRSGACSLGPWWRPSSTAGAFFWCGPRWHRTMRISRRAGAITRIDALGLVVAANPGEVRLAVIQPEGRAAMRVQDFLNGHRVAEGDRFDEYRPTS